MAFGVFALIVTCLVLIYGLIWPKNDFGRDVLAFFSRHSLVIGLKISLLSVIASLIYSNVLGFAPCLLCWYARIALYPQVLLYGMALCKRNSRAILDYSLLLTGFGILVSGYHTIVENVGYSALPCTADGVSCLARPVHLYGFITIPVMALAACVTLFLSVLAAKRGSRTSAESAS